MDQKTENAIETLVLIGDQEFILRISTNKIVFDRWHELAVKKVVERQALSISLVRHDQAEEATAAAIPLVITAPFTPRFKLTGPSSLPSPLMPLLHENDTLCYDMEFIQPDVSESDYVWDNFQDQVVIQTRLERMMVHIVALKDASTMENVVLTPTILPTIKAPSFKLFDYIEQRHNVHKQLPNESSHRMRISQSFHADKKPEALLAPIQKPHTPQRPPSTNQSTGSTSLPRIPTPPTTASTDVTNQLEAKAVILKMRARRAAQLQQTPSLQTVDKTPEAPEVKLDAQLKAELDAFHSLVRSAKVKVVQDMEQAKNELNLYQQLLPKPIVTPRLQSPTIKLAPVDRPSPRTNETAMDRSQTKAPRSKSVSNKSQPHSKLKAPSRLQPLTAVNNQEETPLKTTVRAKREPGNQTQPNKLKTVPTIRKTIENEDDDSDPEMMDDAPPSFPDDLMTRQHDDEEEFCIL